MIRLVLAIMILSLNLCFSQSQNPVDKCIDQSMRDCLQSKDIQDRAYDKWKETQDIKVYELAIKSAETTNNNLYRFIQIALSALAILLSALLSGLGIILAIFFVKEKELNRDVRILKEELDSIRSSIIPKSKTKKPRK